VVSLAEKSGYTFAGVKANSFTYTGATSVANDANSGRVTITFTVTISAPPKTATPTADPLAGAVKSGTKITLETTTSGATIRYTTDGTDPTSASTEYSSGNRPAITSATTIKAIAYKDGMTPSEMLTAAYTITSPPDTGALVTVNFTGPRDETIVLEEDKIFQPGEESLTVSVSGSFSAYRWFLDGVPLKGETESSLSLDVKKLSSKRHELTVFVTKGGVEYAKTLRFIVDFKEEL
jgi:hypothetical protein